MEELAPGLWHATMSASAAGFSYGARMTVVRLADGGLWLHSPVALDAPLRAMLDTAGRVRAAVAPSGMHVAHLPEVAEHYPEALLFAASPLKGRAAERIRVEGLLGDAAPDLWAGEIEQHVFSGSRLYDEVVFFHRASRTLILTDLLFNIPERSGWSTRVWARLLGILGRPSVSRSFHLTVRDRAEVRRSLERILAWDFDRITLTHGDIVPSGGQALFRHAFRRYLE